MNGQMTKAAFVQQQCRNIERMAAHIGADTVEEASNLLDLWKQSESLEAYMQCLQEVSLEVTGAPLSSGMRTWYETTYDLFSREYQKTLDQERVMTGANRGCPGAGFRRK